jgi:hypothetical protein
VKENCFVTQLRRVYKESPVQRIVINTECLHPTINISANNKAPFHFKELNQNFVPLRYTEILTFSFRRFHFCSLEPNSSPLLLGKPRSLMRSFNSFCVIRCNSLNWRSAVKSASVDVEAWGVFSRFSVGLSSESKIYCCGGTGKWRSLVWGTGRIADEILG